MAASNQNRPKPPAPQVTDSRGRLSPALRVGNTYLVRAAGSHVAAAIAHAAGMTEVEKEREIKNAKETIGLQIRSGQLTHTRVPGASSRAAAILLALGIDHIDALDPEL